VRSRASESVTASPEDILFSNNPHLATCGVLTIIKDTVPAPDATDFEFTAGAGVFPSALPQGGGTFKLDNDDNGDLPNTREFSVLPGNRTVTEAAAAHYTLDSIVCTGTGTSSTNTTTRELAFNVGLGQHLTCKFTNKRNPQLTIVKHVVNNSGGSALAGAWTMNVANGPTVVAPFAGSEAGITKEVLPGTYNISESNGPNGYALTYSDNCPGGVISIALGESKTCTLTNDDQPGQLIVIKHVVNNSGGSAAAANWTMNVGGPTQLSFPGAESPGINNPVSAGNYVIGESGGPAGYTLSFSGDCNSQGQVSIALGQTRTCTLTNDDQPATLKVIKHVIKDDGGTAVAGDFTMNVAGPTPLSFPGVEGPGGTSNQVKAGNYNITEAGPDGYTLTYSAECPGGAITLALGESKTCTLTNNDNAATLTVIKHVVTDNGGSAVAGDFTMKVAGPTPLSFDGAEGPGTSNGVDAGDYTITETGGPAGYTLSYSGDCDAEGKVSIAIGQHKTCTLTNNDDPAHLIVIKKVTNDNGGDAVPGDFTMKINGVTVVGGDSFAGADGQGVSREVYPGNFNVTETGPAGYAGTFEGCTGSIALGETKTCTVTNDDQAASLTVIKNVVNDNGGSAQPSAFTMTINGVTAPGGKSFPGDSTGVSRLVNPGSYNVTETGPAGYAATFSEDCTGTIGLGQSKTCTVTNDDKAAHLTVIKHVVNNDGGTASAGSFTMTINGITAVGGNAFPGAEDPGVTREVTPGAYTVTESNVANYKATLSAGCAGSIALGESKTCTITNDDVLVYGNHNPGDVDPGNPYGGDPGDTTPQTPYTPPTTATTTTTTTTIDPQAGVAGDTNQGQPAPEQVLGGEAEPAPSGGFLPRTGAGILGEGMLALLLVGGGLVLMRISRRRRTQPEA
jgi:hypothetical protein